MPEGDVVWLTARRLHDALSGRVLTVTDLRVPRYASTDLSGRPVTEVVARGKHLLTRIDGGVTLHTHLRMEGTWHLYRAGAPARGGPAWQIRAVLANDAWQAVGYRLGIVELLRTEEEHRVVGHLGPDPLSDSWDPREAARRLAADPSRAVGEALLDQRNIAGLGNLYKAEVLFLRGISPWRPVGDIDDLDAVVDLARRLLDLNKDRTGQITTGMAGRGETSWVYGRAGRPCRRCGSPIEHATQPAGSPYGRSTCWCPRCQR